jgi:hypothetical protein
MRTKFTIGDKVKLVNCNNSEGVVVFHNPEEKSGKIWSVRWLSCNSYNHRNLRGMYSTEEIQKYY